MHIGCNAVKCVVCAINYDWQNNHHWHVDPIPWHWYCLKHRRWIKLWKRCTGINGAWIILRAIDIGNFEFIRYNRWDCIILSTYLWTPERVINYNDHKGSILWQLKVSHHAVYTLHTTFKVYSTRNVTLFYLWQHAIGCVNFKPGGFQL